MIQVLEEFYPFFRGDDVSNSNKFVSKLREGQP